MNNILAILGVMLLLAAPLPGNAQSQNPNELLPNPAGATTFAALPKGFAVLTASDEQLANYGFPPRPDQAASPKQYASWAKSNACLAETHRSHARANHHPPWPGPGERSEPTLHRKHP